MIYRNDMDVAKKTGKGRETFCRKFPPFPGPHSPLSKTLTFIESLFILLGEWTEVVFVNEESAVLKILGAF